MPRPTHWSDLKIGLLALAGLVAVGLAVLVFARVGALHGDTTTLYMVTDRASHVIKGTEVWLAGQKVGVVDDVEFRPPTVDTTERIVIRMSVLSEYFAHIRKDSDVQLRPGGSLIGEPVVFITVGTGRAPRLAAGDTLRARREETDRRGDRFRVRDVAALRDSVAAIVYTGKQIASQVRETGGRLVVIRRRTEAQMAVVRHAFAQYQHEAMRERGVVALATRDMTLRASVAHVRAQADSIRALVTGGGGTLGRFRRDTSLATTAAAVLASADTLRARVSDPRRALVRSDSALVRELDLVHVQLDSLVRDVKRHPFKYLRSL